MEFSARALRQSVALWLIVLSASALAQVNVATYHNDNARTGQNTQETVLTPANVNSNQFGKLYTTGVDGYVYAQPLYVAGVKVQSSANAGGAARNVLYVATEHDSLYAIDADNGTVYWQVSLIPAGGTTVNSLADLNCSDLVPEIGITGTPVIDIATNTLYAVAKSKVNGSIVQYLHAIDITSGTEKFGGPTNIQASYPGTASDGNGTTVYFSPHSSSQRSALLLSNGHVIIAWGSHCDYAPYHGWIMSYAANTLVQEAVFNTSPNGFGSGVWQSGAGVNADPAGNIYFATGNGSYNGTTDFGSSIVKLAPPDDGGFALLDYFTAFNQSYLSPNDIDVGSANGILLPPLPSGQQLMVQMGKEGRMYLLDTANLGKYCASCTSADTQIVQEIPNAMHGVWSPPAYWNGQVYWGGGYDNSGPESIKSFSFDSGGSGRMSTSYTSATPMQYNFSGPVPSVSANGSTNGILWGLDNSAFGATCSGGTNCQVLYAYDATNLSRLLYASNQAANNRDVPGGAVKFTTPTIVNGKVYVGSDSGVSAFGLLAPPASGTTSVSLSAVANVDAITANGKAPLAGGIDGAGYAISSNLVGSSVSWGGITFPLGAGGMADAVSNVTIPLPAGNYSTLNLLGVAVYGNQLNQTFVVTYTDNTTSTFQQSMSDWWKPSAEPGQTSVLTMPYRITPVGAESTGSGALYGYAFTLNSAKTVKSLTLPHNRDVVILSAVLGH